MLSKTYSKEEFNGFLESTGEVGYVELVSHEIAYANGLPTARAKELVVFETGQLGQVLSLSEGLVEILVFSKVSTQVGVRVARTGATVKVSVSDNMIGSVIDAFGNFVYDSKQAVSGIEERDADIHATGIDTREKITQTLETGVAVVDLMVPLGMGQRELIIGDRETGKTDFLLQAMLSQSRQGSVCIYASIGKKNMDIKKIEEFLKNNNIMKNSILMVSSSTDPLGIIYLTPYSAMSIAEYFRDKGRNVLLVLDNMTTHAKFYREIALLTRKFPGRGSYPGDIFYTHSRLLERAGNFKVNNKAVSITCLPVAETVESDISGFIQTNLMSITDGHIFFDKDLFAEGRRPAVNYFLSVTRVGRQTQTKLRWGLNRELNELLSLFDKAQRFAHFGAEVSEGIKTTMDMGDKILKFFDQPMGKIMQLNVQMVIFSLIWVGALKEHNEAKLRYVVEKAIQSYEVDPGFRSTVDKLVSSSQDFNDLLGKVSSKGQNLMDTFEQ